MNDDRWRSLGDTIGGQPSAGRMRRWLSGARRRVRQKRQRRAAMLLLTGLSAVALGGHVAFRVTGPEGVVFADGSRVEMLSADARVETGDRRATMHEGRVRFHVVRDERRAFRVAAGDITIDVLGTVFVVDWRPPRASVSVESGRVRVSWPGGAAELGPGDAGVFPPTPPHRARPPVTAPAQTWIGNAFGPEQDKHFQMSVEGLAVAADGTAVTNSFQDPGGRLAGIYRGGDVLGRLGDMGGWGRQGGGAVAIDDQFVYLGMVQAEEGKPGEDYPPDGVEWYCVRRYTRDGRPSPIPEGRGHDRSLRIVSTHLPIRGLAVREGKLYVANGEGRIDLLDTETLTLRRSWPLPGVGPLAVSPQGQVWAVVDDERRIVRVGEAPPALEGVREPVALAFDSAGFLYVADAAREQVLVFDPAGKLVRTLGTRSHPASVDPYRLSGLRGVGVDARGVLHVGLAGPLPWGGASALRAFDQHGTFLWGLESLHGGGGADFAPGSDGRVVYTKHHRFAVDFERGARAQAFTLDPAACPDDVRLHVPDGAPFVREVGGQPWLFHVTADARFLGVFKLGDVARPVALFGDGPASDGWPGRRTPFVWLDGDGDGGIGAGEVHASAQPHSPGWWVDRRGHIWRAFAQAGVVELPMTVRRASSWGPPRAWAMPAPFVRLERVQYDEATDVMYLAGYTDERPRPAGAMGPALIRYDDWSRAPRLRYRISLPWGERTGRGGGGGSPVYPRAFSVAGDRLFVAEGRTPRVAARVYDAATGAPVGDLRIDGGKRASLTLGHGGITAFARSDGEILVLLQHEARSQTVLFRLPAGWRE